jgi:hypothetical protein
LNHSSQNTNQKSFIPYLELFVNNLDAKASILRLKTVSTLGNLTSVDKNNLAPAYIGNVSSFLSDKSIVLQGHVLQPLSKIAEGFPDKAPKILDKLLNSTEHFSHPCRSNNRSYRIFPPYEKLRFEIRKFVESYANSDIKVVARKAKKTPKKNLGNAS